MPSATESGDERSRARARSAASPCAAATPACRQNERLCRRSPLCLERLTMRITTLWRKRRATCACDAHRVELRYGRQDQSGRGHTATKLPRISVASNV